MPGAHFWYFGFLNCEGMNNKIKIKKYTLHATQDDGEEIPFDQDGLNVVYGISFFLWLVGLAVQIYSTRRLEEGGVQKHPVVRLLTLSLILYTAFLFCEMIHFSTYASNGYGAPALEGFGRSKCSFGTNA